MSTVRLLGQRLEFIQSLYERSSAHFREMMSQIEAGEEPYVDSRNPEEYDEPAFLSEWLDANESVHVLGQWSLGMVQAAFKAYLEQFLEDMERWNRFENLKGKLSDKKGNWFRKYQLLLEEDFKIKLESSPVDVAMLEQIILTRNDFEHNADLFTTSVYQGNDHAKKYPDSLFRDDDYVFESRYARVPLKVNREKLARAINAVMGFCVFIEAIGEDYSAYLRFLATGTSTPEKLDRQSAP
jgi:hypothetical protein